MSTNGSIEQMKGVFPEDQYEPKELPLDHKIFQCVYPLKEKPQVPSIHAWGGPGSDITWERRGTTVIRQWFTTVGSRTTKAG